MPRKTWIGVVWLVTWCLVLSAIPSAQAGVPAPGDPRLPVKAQTGARIAGKPAPDRYIVTLRQDAGLGSVVSNLRRRLDLAIDLEFEHAINGFAAELTPAQVTALEADPRVLMVEPDIWLEAHDVVLPTGVDRIGADSTLNGLPPTRAGSPVAVLDTGIARHPDLNVAGGYNCTSRDRTDYGDRDGHGTHVAGTIGARGGVVGVAPGTPIWGIKVLDDTGTGLLSWSICGLDWVTANHDRHGIVAINMSLGGPDFRGESATNCASSGFHRAICQAHKAGIDVVVSAGNNNKNAAGFTPAKYSQAVTVAAMTDSDGCAGGRGGQSSYGRRDKDDRKWIHSNFGEAVDVIAPGVDIRSTVPGGYDFYSGTSMAAPHVTGAIALGWDAKSGGRERGIPGFSSGQGLVQLSDNVTCRGINLEDPIGGGEDAAAGNPKLKLRPKSARPGDQVTVKLTGFAEADRVQIDLRGKRVDLVTTNDNGSGQGRFRIPGDTGPGRHVVRGDGASGASDAVRLRIKPEPRRR